MSELIFGPSADRLPLMQNECVQPRLDGGYDFTQARKIGDLVCSSIIKSMIYNLNQPTLFDDDESMLKSFEFYEQPTLFEE